MLTHKTVSFKTIFAKIYRDLQLKNDDDLFVDVLEWSAEALDQIGVYNQYDRKQACIDIVNYKGEIPSDLISLELASYNNIVINSSTSVDLPIDTSATTNYGYLTPYSSNQGLISSLTLLLNEKYFFNKADYFLISENWFKTSFEKGKLNIVYMAQPLDTDGFPLIPDEVSYKEAIYWYIVYKISYAQARRGEIQSSFYTDAYDKWLWYCNQAGAKAMMPDLNMLENLKRSFISLKPNLYKFNNQFSNASK